MHVLAEDQLELSDRFCRPSRNKFAGLETTEGLGGAPILDGVVALFECRREQRHDAGDHVILVGRVERYHHTDRPPLVFHAQRLPRARPAVGPRAGCREAGGMVAAVAVL